MEIIQESLLILSPSQETLNSGLDFETCIPWMIQTDHLRIWDTNHVSRIT